MILQCHGRDYTFGKGKVYTDPIGLMLSLTVMYMFNHKPKSNHTSYYILYNVT